MIQTERQANSLGTGDATLNVKKLRPNRCRLRHGYYWQPIRSRQRPIR